MYYWKFTSIIRKTIRKQIKKKECFSTESKDQRYNIKRTEIIFVWGGFAPPWYVALYAKVWLFLIVVPNFLTLSPETQGLLNIRMRSFYIATKKTFACLTSLLSKQTPLLFTASTATIVLEKILCA